MSLSISLPSTLTPLGQSVSTPSALADPIPQLAPKIDPITHDFVSLFEGMDPVDAKVVNSIKIVRGSGPAVIDIGTRFADIRKINNSTVNEIKTQVYNALLHLIRDGDIRYVGTIIDYNSPGEQTVQFRIQWVNLRTFDDRVRSATLSLSET